MAKLVWDESGQRLYETGVKKGVLYPAVLGAYPKGVVWNGLISVTENPTGGEPNPEYADDIKYLNLMSTEEFGASIEAFTYPEEFAECDGSAEVATGVYIGQQDRKTFGLCYRTTIGNDEEGTALGYKIHLIYGALAAPTDKAYQTIGETPEAITFSWEISTTPIAVNGFKPTASLVVDSTKVAAAKMTELETILYGTETVEAMLPLPDAVITLVGTAG